MKQIDIVFTKSKKKFPIGSWIIRWWTKKPYSHVARGIKVRNWAYLYYQANEGEVNYEVKKEFDKKHEIIKKYQLLVPDHLDEAIKKACIEDSGKPYGVMQNIGIFIVDIVYWITGKTIRNPWRSGRNCSETIYENVFLPMYPKLTYNKETIKPHQIEEIILDKFSQKGLDWVPKKEKQNGNS